MELDFSTKEFLTVDPWSQNHPDFLMNFDISEDCEWQHVKVQPLPPACLDVKSGKDVGSLMRITSYQPVLRSGLWEGLWLTAKNARMLCLSYQTPLPAKGMGSGKSKQIVKIDYALSLVTHFHAAESDQEKLRMVNAIMNRRGGGLDLDLSVLSTVAALDPENAEAFKDVSKKAFQDFTQEIFKRGRESQKKDDIEQQAKEHMDKLEKLKAVKASAESTRLWGLTPNDLKLLLPGEGAISGVFAATYHPILGHFRVIYPVEGNVLSCSCGCRFNNINNNINNNTTNSDNNDDNKNNDDSEKTTITTT